MSLDAVILYGCRFHSPRQIIIVSSKHLLNSSVAKIFLNKANYTVNEIFENLALLVKFRPTIFSFFVGYNIL